MVDGSSLQLGGQLGNQVGGVTDGVLVGRAQEARDAAESGESDQAAQKFEALLATTLVKEMRKALPEGFFGKGAGSDVFEGWLDEHIGNALAESGALDLAGMIKFGIGTKEAADGGPEGARS